MAKTAVHFDGLNLLRFISSMMILIYHSWINSQVSGFTVFHDNLPVGVDFFFIISGFLITYLLLSEKENSGTINFKAFYLRRTLRIFPLYYLIILISFLVFGWRSSININYPAQLYFWGNFETIHQQNWIGGFLTPLWSLCVEEHFYLLIPFLIFLIPGKGVKWMFTGIILLSIAVKIYFATHLESYWLHINCHTLSKMDVIALGGLLACFHFENRIRLNTSPLSVSLLVLLIIVLMSTIHFFDYAGIANAAFKRYLITIPFILFFCFFIFNQNESLMMLKRNKYLSYLGSLSFGIYMYHSIVLFCIKPWFPDQTIPQKIVVVIITSFVTIGLAAISFRYIETPFLRLKNRFEKIETQAS